MLLGSMPELTLRRATLSDVPVLERWDREPHVIAATTDDTDAEKAFGDHDWSVEIPKQSEVSEFLIAELDGRPIGAMQIIDPHEEPTHYWGEVAPNLRAIDIWIGDAADHGKGHGETMMRLAFQRCFAVTAVTAVIIDPLASNTRAHKFYQRIGFAPLGRQMFGDDDCLVHQLSREAWRTRFPDD
jgi:aminoglycoside 6'-N-acetyltransferase